MTQFHPAAVRRAGVMEQRDAADEVIPKHWH